MDRDNMKIIDCTGIENQQQMHQLLAQALSFPDYYGHNLDALMDCLTDIRERTGIHVFNKDALYENLGPMAHGLLRVLRDAAEENPELHVEM